MSAPVTATPTPGIYQSGFGYMPFLLDGLKSVSGMNTPSTKLDDQGFLGMLLSNNRPQVLNLTRPNGGTMTAKIKYKQRFSPSQVSKTPSCDTVAVSGALEADVQMSSFNQFAVHIEDAKIALYQDEAMKAARVPGAVPAPNMLMQDLYEDVLNAANAINSEVNSDLTTTAIANIGVNRTTGLSTARAINIALDATQNNLATGEVQMLKDYTDNGGRGRPKVVGSGLFHAYILQQVAKNANFSGVDTRLIANQLDFYNDLAFATALGGSGNEVVVYEPQTTQLVTGNQYTGAFAGMKPGSSWFGTIPLPVMINPTTVGNLRYDVQMRYNDCDQTYTESGTGSTLTLKKGYNLILSLYTGLFQIPADAYQAGDPLLGNRGSYRYDITNA